MLQQARHMMISVGDPARRQVADLEAHLTLFRSLDIVYVCADTLHIVGCLLRCKIERASRRKNSRVEHDCLASRRECQTAATVPSGDSHGQCRDHVRLFFFGRDDRERRLETPASAASVFLEIMTAVVYAGHECPYILESRADHSYRPTRAQKIL